jgi:large subunit ribosomal protein L1
MNKRYKEAIESYDREELYEASEAVSMSKRMATAKFDETIELVLRLGIDPRKAEEMVRGTVALPAGTGRDVRVAVFAQGEPA